MDTIFGIPTMIVGTIVRHGLTAAAGYLVANGYASSGQGEALATGAMAAVAVGWSAWQKYRHAKAIASASSK